MVLTIRGIITWIPPYLVTTTCKVDHTWFPFDQQKCRIKFGSWSCTADMVDLREKEDSLDTATYVLNLDWHLESADGRKSEISYGPGATYQSMTFIISLKRRSFNLARPVLNRHNVVLIQSSLLVIANVLSFLVPASHPSPRLLLHLFPELQRLHHLVIRDCWGKKALFTAHHVHPLIRGEVWILVLARTLVSKGESGGTRGDCHEHKSSTMRGS